MFSDKKPGVLWDSLLQRARWTKKGDAVHYGYKDHTKVDADSKLIADYSVTPANVHDSNEFLELLDESDEVVHADSAYIGRELPEYIENRVRERFSRETADKRAERKQPRQIKHEMSGRACVRIYDGIHARSDGSLCRDETRGVQHRPHKPCLQHLQVHILRTREVYRGITMSKGGKSPSE